MLVADSILSSILDQLSIEDLEQLLERKRKSMQRLKPKPMTKWDLYEIEVRKKLEKMLYPPIK